LQPKVPTEVDSIPTVQATGRIIPALQLRPRECSLRDTDALALAAAHVPGLEIFRNTEFLSLTFINVAQTVVAFQINAATLMRTIASG
jgi:hypothetical protein